MESYYLIQGAALLAQAQAGSEMFSNDLKNRAFENWEKSKDLPRKQKKLMRKHALADLTIANWTEDFSSNLFSL